ncbi:MAG: hypothetical protein VKJ64_18260 [Leptolyngbyaceae bacterium]|nr:hypothetical protein [Leptolyngbyaceae bacterium]
MIQIKTMKQIATSRTIPGLQSLATLGRSHYQTLHYRAVDSRRIYDGICQIESQESRRLWLNQQWHDRRWQNF